MISDSILSWNKFIDDVAFSGPLIMLTYYAAQFCIANSIGMKPSFHLSKGLKSERPIQ
ncbi:lysoplasmalogenase family protein [Peribacillus sp. V2I11]|uniref:lysoplasmalogenase family protein n=1 Tax=Peribacillus sp. V2I11 TaxID=3042277 RepID=UPI0027D850D7|nr:lysoplasmalogenase family protein [Peribacillus sp. V2I11]